MPVQSGEGGESLEGKYLNGWIEPARTQGARRVQPPEGKSAPLAGEEVKQTQLPRLHQLATAVSTYYIFINFLKGPHVGNYVLGEHWFPRFSPHQLSS